MRRKLELLVGSAIAALVVSAAAWSALAAEPGLMRQSAALAPMAGMNADAALAGCTKMQASEVAWVTLDDEGEIDEQVSEYPSGTTTVTPVFQYNCVPKSTTLVTVFTFDGETVLTDKETLKASSRKGLYSYPISYEDERPIDEGEWGVQFYSGKTLLTAGAVSVGEGESGGAASQTVTVEGKVTDKKTKKPVKSATILVLNPGVTIQKFINGGQKDKDVYTAAQTDSKGEFALGSPLEREQTYAIIVVAKGYKATGHEGFTVASDAPDPLVLTITMAK